MKRFVSEWFETLVEDLDRKSLNEALSRCGVDPDKELRELKTLELFSKEVLGDNRNRIAPLYWLADLRIWADHRGADQKLADVIAALGLDANSTREVIYRTLFAAVTGYFEWLQISLQKGAT